MATIRVQQLPPVSRAHQEGLRCLITQLQTNGQDVTLLAQLAESLPRLRAGLSANERERIEELDANQAALINALASTQAAITTLAAMVGAAQQPLASSVLVDSANLRQIAATAQLLAEAANDLALRSNSRAGWLE